MSMTEEVAGQVHLYPGIADTHTHLILWQTKEMDWKTLFQTCVEGGLELALDVGTNTDTFEERLSMVNQFDQLYITDGLSVSKSELEAGDLKRRLDLLEKQVAANVEGGKLIAVGEIGLDNHFEYGGVERQKELFAAQLDIANAPQRYPRRNNPLLLKRLGVGKEVPGPGILHIVLGQHHIQKIRMHPGSCSQGAGRPDPGRDRRSIPYTPEGAEIP